MIRLPHTQVKEYNRNTMTKMEEFLVQYRNPSQGVNTLLDNEARIMETNQKVIESLLKIVILCGKQGIALGHRDMGYTGKMTMEA